MSSRVPLMNRLNKCAMRIAGQFSGRNLILHLLNDDEFVDQLSNFEELEGYITRTLGDRKEAAKVKLESPLGVAERFLNTYEQASSMGAKVSAEDVEAIGETEKFIPRTRNFGP